MKPLLLSFLLLAGVNAWAADAGLAQCRGLTDAQARLACYDALPLPATAPAPAAAQTAPAPVPAAAVSAAPDAKPASWFGFDKAPAAEAPPSEVNSRYEGRFEGWGPRSQIKLANGQVWQIVDDSSAYFVAESPRVTVSRGFLTSYFLKVEGLNQQPKVKRIK